MAGGCDFELTRVIESTPRAVACGCAGCRRVTAPMQAITNRCAAPSRAANRRLAILRADASDPRRHGALLRVGAAGLPGDAARPAPGIGDPGAERLRAVLRAAVHAV